jgi:hypothetical protein
MLSDAEALLLLKDCLTERIDDVVTFGRSVEGKALRKEYRRLAATMQQGDELWNYYWSQERPHMLNYEYGWCVVRNGVPIAKYMVHTS